MKHSVFITICFLTIIFPQLLAAETLQTRTDTIPIVDAHVGDDDERGDTFVYNAPVEWEITDIQLRETGKYGDAQYSIASRTNNEVKVAWHVHSHRVRGPFQTVLDTKTAYLGLIMNITLQKLPDPASAKLVTERGNDKQLKTDSPPEQFKTDSPPEQFKTDSPPEQWSMTVSVVSGLAFIVVILVIALFIPHPSPFQLFVFRIILAIAAAGFGSSLPGVLGIKIAPIPDTMIEGGGAIALFVLIYTINPARLASSKP